MKTYKKDDIDITDDELWACNLYDILLWNDSSERRRRFPHRTTRKKEHRRRAKPFVVVVWGAQSERVVLEEVSFYLDLFFLISWTPSFFSLYKLSAFLSPLFSSSS